MRCPACGQPTDERLIVYPSGAGALIDGASVPMRPREAQILEILYRNWGHITHGHSIAEIIGTNSKSVKVHITHLRAAIFQTKLVVDSKRSHDGGYWLRWLPER